MKTGRQLTVILIHYISEDFSAGDSGAPEKGWTKDRFKVFFT
jgi:hypothetical protein